MSREFGEEQSAAAHNETDSKNRGLLFAFLALYCNLAALRLRIHKFVCIHPICIFQTHRCLPKVCEREIRSYYRWQLGI